MNLWRLSLAPHKCAQTVFSKAFRADCDDLKLKLYGRCIPFDSSPKFLGIVFDSRLTFEKHHEFIKEKIKDRLNILKILSYDKNWSLKTHILVNVYKSLIRSVLDYASVTSVACSQKIKDDFEVIQNNSLRIIFKISIFDYISVEELRERANVTSINQRHENLLNDYYERALVTHNPLLNELFTGYKKFKMRSALREQLAIDESGEVNLECLDLIRHHNSIQPSKEETYPTTLCKANKIIKDLILDNYGQGIIGAGVG